jgi:hypothetical protein
VLLVLVQLLVCAATSYPCERYLGVSLFAHVSSSLHFLDSFFNSFLQLQGGDSGVLLVPMMFFC